MSENHRARIDGEWITGTPYVRRGGKWEEFGTEMDPGDLPEDAPEILPDGRPGKQYQLLGAPPERSGDTLTVGSNGEDYSTIQAAIDNVSDDETILVSPGTYNETLDLSAASASGWTLAGNGANPSDVEVIRAGSSVVITDHADVGSVASTSVTDTMSIGDDHIPVSSTSGFEVGMEVEIYDPNQEYYDNGDDGYDVAEVHKISSVDASNDRLYVEYDGGIIQEYTENSGSHVVRDVDWSVENIHVTNMRFDGDGEGNFEDSSTYTNRRGFRLRGVRDAWVTDCEISNGEYSGLEALRCHYCRYENVTLEHIGGWRGYGFNCVSFGPFYLLNCETDETSNYGIKFAGSAGNRRGCYNGVAHDCDVLTPHNNYATDCHEGGRQIYFVDVYAEDCDGMGKISSSEMRWVGCHAYNVSSHGMFRATKYARDIRVEDQLFTGSGRGSDNYLFRLEIDQDFRMPVYGDFYVDGVTVDFNSNFTDDDDVGSITFSSDTEDGPYMEGDFHVHDFKWPASDIVDHFEDEDHFCEYSGSDGCELFDDDIDFQVTSSNND